MKMSTTTANIRTLNGQKFVNLTTFRKDGTPVSTPMMFAENDGKIYLVTGKTTGKLKRIMRDSHVAFAPSDSRGTVLGETLSACARILSDEEWSAMKSSLRWSAPAPIRFIFNRLRDLRAGGNVYLEVTLA